MSDGGDRAEALGSGDEFAGMDELISDLAALLDAGVLVVHEPVLGPARYGVAPSADQRHADAKRVHRSWVGIMHG
jgi:hypothetical protein